MGNQIWGQNIYVITTSMKIIWNSAILSNVEKWSLIILPIMTARKRLTFKVVWAAFDEHRIMKHDMKKWNNDIHLRTLDLLFDPCYLVIAYFDTPPKTFNFIKYTFIHNKWQNKTRHCIVWLFDLVLQTLREPVAAKEFEAEVSVGSESFCTPGFLMLFRVSLAGGKIMETIWIEWKPLSDILLVDFKNLIERRKK